MTILILHQKLKMAIIMKRFFIAIFFLPALFVMVTPSWANQGIVTLTLEPGGTTKAKRTRVWMPYPISNTYQDIRDISIHGNASYSAVYSDPDNGALHLFAEWEEHIPLRRLVLQFLVSAKERSAGSLHELGLPIPVEIKKYLKSNTLIPIDGEIKKIAEEIIAKEKGVLEKARAIYDWVVENTTRDPNVRGCGLGIVEVTLSKRSGKCADISSVYVALARASGVPAREVFGLRLGNKMEQDITNGYHCWAEFYLPGTGWVPVDPSDVRKIMLVKKLDLENVEDQREYYFGTVDAYRITLRRGGRGLTLWPKQEAGPINYLMYPYAEVDGEPLDFTAPQDFRYTVYFKAIE